MFELSCEHPSFPASEAEALCNLYNGKVIKTDDGVLIGKVDDELVDTISDRIAMCHRIDKFLFECDLDEIEESFKNLVIDEGSICVRVKRVFGKYPELSKTDLERKIGAIIAKGRVVNLEEPDIEIRILLSKKIYCGVFLKKIDRGKFEMRKPQFRPFFSPISLHPRIARAMVNLSQIKKNELLVDPFCGTGGILIEGALIGARIGGGDIDHNMIMGARDNLAFYSLDFEFMHECHISKLPEYINECADAVVTDTPYGRSASTAGESISEIYKDFLEACRKILKKEKRCVMMCHEPNLVPYRDFNFKLLKKISMRVHRSLNRYILVLLKN